MFISADKLVKVSTVLGILLSLTTLGTTKASALDLPGLPVSLPLDQLVQRGLELEPKLMDDSLNRNNLQLCLPICSLGIPTNTPAVPQQQRMQPQVQSVPQAPRSIPAQNMPPRRPLPSPQ